MERGKPTPAKSLRALRLIAGFGLLAFAISLILNVYWIFQYQKAMGQVLFRLRSKNAGTKSYMPVFRPWKTKPCVCCNLTILFKVSDSSGWELKAVWITNDSGLLIHIDSFPSEGSMTLLQVRQDSLNPITIDTLNSVKAKDLVYYLPLSSRPDSLLLTPQGL